jgi:hypothetical protein
MRPRTSSLVRMKTFATRHPFASAGFAAGGTDAALAVNAARAGRAGRGAPLKSALDRLSSNGSNAFDRSKPTNVPLQNPQFDFGPPRQGYAGPSGFYQTVEPAVRSTGFHHVPFTVNRPEIEEEER